MRRLSLLICCSSRNSRASRALSKTAAVATPRIFGGWVGKLQRPAGEQLERACDYVLVISQRSVPAIDKISRESGGNLHLENQGYAGQCHRHEA